MTWRLASFEASSGPCVTELVTGGKGVSLTHRLVLEGARARVLARSRAKVRPLADPGTERVVRGDRVRGPCRSGRYATSPTGSASWS